MLFTFATIKHKWEKGKMGKGKREIILKGMSNNLEVKSANLKIR